MSKTRMLLASAACVASIVAAAPVANAGTPGTKACVGRSVSSFSTTFIRSGFLYRDFAQDPTTRPGLGDAVQGLQAGLVADDVFPNTCNG
jgi:hypothetical protein